MLSKLMDILKRTIILTVSRMQQVQTDAAFAADVCMCAPARALKNNKVFLKQHVRRMKAAALCVNVSKDSGSLTPAYQTTALHNLLYNNKAKHRAPPTLSRKPDLSSVCETTKNTASMIYS